MAILFVPTANMRDFESMYEDKIKWQKSVRPQYQFFYVQEKNPFGFFIQIYFFPTAYRHFLPEIVQVFL